MNHKYDPGYEPYMDIGHIRYIICKQISRLHSLYSIVCNFAGFSILHTFRDIFIVNIL